MLKEQRHPSIDFQALLASMDRRLSEDDRAMFRILLFFIISPS
jgi:hypothetical protein